MIICLWIVWQTAANLKLIPRGRYFCFQDLLVIDLDESASWLMGQAKSKPE